MKRMKGVVITGTNTLAVSEDCPLPEKICPTGALIRPLIWSPCTSDAHLCATGCASLPYLLGKAVGHEMCGEIIEVGPEVHDFKPGDRVIVCSVMPVWRSLEAQDGHAKNRQDNMYAGIDYPDRGGSFVEQYYIRDADMNLTKIPEGVTLEQAVMVPDMMCTAFEGVQALNLKFGQSVAVLGIGPVGLMAVRAAVLQGAGNIFAIGSRQVCFDVAKEYGATHLVDYHHENYIEQIVQDNGGPVDGVILTRSVKLGDLASAGTPMAVLAQPEELCVHVDINEQYIERIWPGQQAQVAFTDDSGQPRSYTATVARIDDTGITSGGVTDYTVELTLDSTDGLRDGMNVNVAIITEQKEDCLRIPSQAVSGGTVQVLRDGKAVEVEVETGISGGGYTEILQGLTTEDEVLLP